MSTQWPWVRITAVEKLVCIIFKNIEEIYNTIEDNTIFNTMDNINLSRIASLSVAVEEMLKFGKAKIN